ncbi:MAG: DoxX family protein, partial [Proteiniphilum sp.]
PEVVGDWEQQNKSGFQFAHADERVLKTMIRSNPGLMLLKEGTVMGKWDDSTVPATKKIALIIK